MARTVVLIYGIINLLGGIMGTVASKKPSSMIAGGTAGLILLYCWYIAPTKPGIAFRTAGIVSVAMIGFWIYRLNEMLSQDRSPMMAAGNLFLAVVVLGLLGYAHFAAQKKKVSE